MTFTFFLSWLARRTDYSVAVATSSHFCVNWVILWYSPLWMENVAALGGAGLLTVLGLAALYLPASNAGSKSA